MRQILDRVTVTGADDSVSPTDLGELQKQFPFVEWGILVSKGKTFPAGTTRFPSVQWMQKLDESLRLRMSVHLCGWWVRRICAADLMWLRTTYDIALLIGCAERVQLNFHGHFHELVRPLKKLAKELTLWWPGKQVICQVDGANDDIVSNLYDLGARVAGLYDRSGGAGQLPEAWPGPLRGIPAGYAGGLSAENVEEQLVIISELVDDPIWIDVETHVRSDNDQQFDLGKVEAFLKAAEPWVIKKEIGA